MSDEVWQRAEPQSPCKKICLIHPENGVCVGCFRTRAEIAGWLSMSTDQRRKVLAALPEREKTLAPTRRGGRSARIRRNSPQD